MQGPSTLHLLQLAADPSHPVAYQPAVGLDLGFAWAAEKAEAAALPFEVGPAPDEASRLVIQVRKFDLQSPFRGRGALTENLQDQACAIDNLGPRLFLERFLLYRSKRSVDDQEPSLISLRDFGDLLRLSFAEKSRRPRRSQPECAGRDDLHANCPGKSDRLVKLGISRAAIPLPMEFHSDNDGLLPARNIVSAGRV
jgi:hypothetical protein